MKLHPATTRRFARIVDSLLAWHSASRKWYLWRELRKTPYVVLVSEFMLQQTGTKQVEKMLPPFLKRFPTVQALAKASTADVLRAWQGLGYNRRALNLHKAAQAIAKRGRKPFPNTLDELRALPGVGAYTAAAVMTFVHNANVPVVDVNIERVLSRLWQPMKDYSDKRPMRDIFELNAIILPHGNSAAWHEALMDLGSTICTKRKPKCEECSLLDECKSGPRFIGMEKRDNAPVRISGEKTYFGAPRRIWRGRVLSLIVSHERISKRKLLASLEQSYGIAAADFTEFIASLVDALAQEGFAKKQGQHITLGQ